MNAQNFYPNLFGKCVIFLYNIYVTIKQVINIMAVKTLYLTIRLDVNTERDGEELENDILENLVLTSNDDYPMDITICDINH